MFKFSFSRGFSLFEIVAIILIMGVVFAFGTPKYIKIVHDTHNANIDMMVHLIELWSAEQAVENLPNAGCLVYPLPNTVKIDCILKEGILQKWDDTNPEYWKYIAGGGIKITGDGSYLHANPVYVN